MPTQQYYNGAHMEEIVHGVTTKIKQRNKSMTYTDKDYVEGSFNLKNPEVIICTLYFILTEIWSPKLLNLMIFELLITFPTLSIF